MEDLEVARQFEGPVSMLGGGNPAHIDAVEQRFREQMQHIANDQTTFARMVGDYDAPKGNSRFITLLADMLNRQFDWGLTPDNIAITNGSQSSFGLIFNLLAGDFPDGNFRPVLLPITPEYVGYADVGIASQPLFEGHRPTIERLPDQMFKYRIDLSSLHIDKRYGAVCVSRPTNPTGNVITDAELDSLSKRCEQHRVPLIIDGAYGLPFPGILFKAAKPRWNTNTVLCLSLSKLGLAGLRTGIVIADTPLIELIRNGNAINALAPSRVGPELIAPLLPNDELLTLCRDHIRPFYETRSAWAIDRVKHHLGHLPIRIHQSEGAIFLWIWFEDLPVTSDTLYRSLAQQGVFVLSGHHFFPGLQDDWRHRHQCIRINFAAPESSLERGLGIIAQTVAALYP